MEDTVKIKSELYSIIEQTNDINVLYKYKLFIETFNTDKVSFELLPEEIINEIEEGLSDFKNGNIVSHEEVMKKYENRI